MQKYLQEDFFNKERAICNHVKYKSTREKYDNSM